MAEIGKVLLVFHNYGEGYNYFCPVYATKEKGENGDYYIVTKGTRTGHVFDETSCFSSDGLLDNILGSGGNYIFKPIGKHEFSNNIVVLLDSKIEKHVSELLHKDNKNDITIGDYISALLNYADKIGCAIGTINKKYLGDFYADIVNSDFVDNLNVIDKNILNNGFEHHKLEARAEAKKYNSDNKSTNETIKKDDIIFNKEKNSDKTIIDKNENDSNNGIDIKNIKSDMRKKIISQDNAIDVVVNNIYFNQRYIDTGDSDLIRNKANIILEGATGTGKTYIIEEVAKKLKLPVLITPATNYSSVGYRGDDLTDILYKLLDKANGNLELAERGIVAFDEFDKLGTTSNQDIAMRRAVQQELLSFISGSKFDVNYRNRSYSFDTSKLTFIATGAFTELRERKIQENEKKYTSPIGFSPINEEDIKHSYIITKDDYISEGLERELVGRFSCLTYTNDLSVNDLEKILIESTSSPLNGLKLTGNIMGCNIIVPQDVIHEIAKLAFDTNTGARGLNEIVQSLKDVISNDLFSGKKELTISKEHLDKSQSIRERVYQVRKGR